ncbi:hypothetical protein E4Z66_18280 [Aliishimia ponticola]|uniref:Thiol:disulfide interchange protein DsbD N-terminal domain-containing protein n=2 Tax=Aliishimia ponticola TaxID=2499833 RepID=A0A4S4NEM8_9RHOB|nr:hypothetical protein E4Z66_18280 [Aliishimia ponticola]
MGIAGDPTAGILSHRVITGWQQADGTRMAGLELTLAPGWKTYWRSPGDAGIPPEFTWNGARNLSGVHVHWPTPRVFWQSGMRSVGYAERVVLPLTLSPKSAGKDIRLKGRVDLGVCADICMPATIRIDSTLPSAESERSPEIVAALAALPFSAQEAGVRSAICALSPTADGLEVKATITMPAAGSAEEAVIEAQDPSIWVSEPSTSRSGQVLTVRAEMIQQTGAPLAVDRSGLRITVISAGHAVDIQGCTG